MSFTIKEDQVYTKFARSCIFMFINSTSQTHSILMNISMSGQFTNHIFVSAIAGFIIAFPYVFWEIWRFVKPALYTKESKHAKGVVFFSSLLFMSGVLFGYYVIAPLAVNFLGSYQVSELVSNQINLGSYITTVASINKIDLAILSNSRRASKTP